MASFPIFSLSPFDLSSYFTYQNITLNELEILNKKIYNYPSLEEMAELTTEEKAKLVQYYLFLSYTYFNTTLIEEIGEDVKEMLFDYDQWNALSKYIMYDEEYTKSNLIVEYNRFIKNQFNAIFGLVTNDFNNYIEILNTMYETNKFENGDYIFKPIDENRFSDAYKTLYLNYNSDRNKGIAYMEISKTLPTEVKKTHIIVIK